MTSGTKSNYNEKGQDFPTDTVWVGEINEKASVEFHDTMMSLIDEDPFKPIIININSYGGEVDALFSMLDTMDAVRNMAPPEFKFLTVVKGKACSAGAVLLSYGDFRFSEPNARIMLHQTTSGQWGSHPANEVEFEETSRMNTKLLHIIKKQCKLDMTVKELKAKLSHNLYFTPEKAKDFGLIDIIGYPKVLESKVYDVRIVNGEKPNATNRSKNKRTPKVESKD